MIGRNDPCWCGSGKKYKKCHLSIDQARHSHPGKTRAGILIKTEGQIDGIRAASRMTAQLLDMVAGRIRAGITTNEIDSWVHEETIARGGIPAPLNYHGFPKSVCTSLNDEICHGIPDKTILKHGDIINVDITTILDGYYGDASRMFMIGEVSDKAREIIEVAGECLSRGIRMVKPGNRFGDIGWTIQEYAENKGFSVVRDYTGHGVGIEFHEPPNVCHYGKRGTGELIQPDMVFTIEPMINAGTYKCRLLSNGWTAVTRDGALSAQWEHTVRVTGDGVEILT
ncbi:MAG: methionyl aminopeptidase [Candidatus Auribacterota bacterium]|nr:methionyl aminopeptidase [Candidatus Auribacterota bacterium]